jgi:hypothetical protein
MHDVTACARAGRGDSLIPAPAREIMRITGHETLSEVQRYPDAVDKARHAEQRS